MSKVTALPERIQERIMPLETGCWLWTGQLNGVEYGLLWVLGGKGKTNLAHRVVYENLDGPIPEGLELDHLCRNRGCVNPDHLEPVTHKENVRRGEAGLATGQQKRNLTHCPKGHPYLGENLYVDPRGNRNCRICRRKSQAKYMIKRRNEIV